MSEILNGNYYHESKIKKICIKTLNDFFQAALLDEELFTQIKSIKIEDGDSELIADAMIEALRKEALNEG